jgi:hypothetical protein
MKSWTPCRVILKDQRGGLPHRRCCQSAWTRCAGGRGDLGQDAGSGGPWDQDVT